MASIRSLPAAYHPTFVAGHAASSSHARTFLNLRAGLDRIGVSSKGNDFGFARKNPKSLVSNASPADGLRFEITLMREQGVWTGTYHQEFTRTIVQQTRPGDISFDECP